MAGERQLNWGASETDATYVTGDAGDGGNFVVAEDTDGNTILLEWDTAAGEWVYGGPVNLSGEDLSNVGSVDAQSVSTDELDYADRINRTYRIAPGTSDAGADINQILADVNGEHVVIEVPGEARLPIGTQVNFSPGVNGQSQDQVVWIKGEGNPLGDSSPNIGTNRGSLFVNDGLSSDMFVCNGARWALRLSDFGIANTPSGQFGLNLDAVRFASTVENITVDGNDTGNGIRLSNCYGATFKGLHAYYCADSPFVSEINNAATFRNVEVRRNSQPVGTYAFLSIGDKGTAFENVYVESNEGPAIDIADPEASEYSVYAENNSAATSPSQDVLIRGTTGTTVDVSGGIISGNNSRSLYTGNAVTPKLSNLTVASDTNVVVDGEGAVFAACELFDLDTSPASSGSTLINTEIRGTWTNQTADARLPQDV